MESEEKKKNINFILPNEAQNYLLNPIKYTGDPIILKNQKILLYIYESILKLYESKKQLSYIPNEIEVYEDLEFRKKAIGDKTILPSREEIYKYYFILASYKPVFLFLLRELVYNPEKKFYFITKFALPFNNDFTFLEKGITQVIHNSLVTFRNHYQEINPTNRLKEKIVNFRNIEELEDILETGQMYVILKKIYFYKNLLHSPVEEDLFRINVINQRIKEMILTPLIYELTKEKLIISIKRNYLINSPDILLINNHFHIELRLNLLLDLIHNPLIKEEVIKQFSTQDKILLESKNRLEQALILSKSILDNQNNPHSLLLLASEILSLYEYIQKMDQIQKKEQLKSEFQELYSKLTKTKGILRIKNKDKLLCSPQIIEYILSNKIPNILFATIPVFDKNYTNADDYSEIYILLNDKKHITLAIEQAKELYDKVQDIHLIRILEQLLKYHELSDNEIQKLIPSYLLEELEEIISKSYYNQLPLFKRFLYKILNEKIDKKTLHRLWKDYCSKNQISHKNQSQLSQTIKETKIIQKEKEVEPAIKSLYKELLNKIEWYLQRDIIPTEEIIFNDFKEQKKDLYKLFQLIHSGLKTFQDITFISAKDNTYLFTKDYLIKNKESLQNKYKNKIQEIEGIQTKDGHVLSLKTEKENLELYKKILQLLEKI